MGIKFPIKAIIILICVNPFFYLWISAYSYLCKSFFLICGYLFHYIV